MKIGVQPEGALERVAMALNLVPTPLIETQVAYNSARAIMAGAALGIYEACQVARTADEVAAACKTHPRATRQLLDCLTGLDYLEHGDGRYELPTRLRKWLLRDSPTSVVDKLIFQLTEWNWMARLEDFVRSGEPIHFHAHMTGAEWAQYQEGMRDLSATLSVEVAKKLKLPAGATRMLDVGGSHGLYSIALCKKYPLLASTILELPGAMDRATQIAARQGLGDRVKHQVGNALTDDLGEAQYDLVFISNVVHHFSVPENVTLARKVKRALKPNGLYVVGEFLRGERPGEGGGVGATADLYFALTSASGTWSLTEIQSWMREAGLTVVKPLRYLGPNYVSVVARNR